MLGRSVWAVINAYHAALREKGFFPDEIFLFAEGKKDEKLSKDIHTTINGLKILSEEFKISPLIKTELISEREYNVSCNDDFVKMVLCAHDLITKKKKEGYVIALDITPGRKTLIAGALLPIKLSDVDHIFYLSIKETVPLPYMMIPYQIQHMNDFKEQVMRTMHGA